MCGGAARRIIRTTLPIDHWLTCRQTFPPGLVIGGERHVGEQRIAVDRLEGVPVGFRIRSRHHAEVARFRVYRPQASVRTGVQPRDVIANGEHFPPRHRVRRNQHRQVRLSARGRECAGDVVCFALRVLQADDEHVLRQPTFRARLVAGDAQSVALLTEQCVSAVTRTEALDGEFFGEVHDETPLRIELADRVQSADERAIGGDALERRAPYTRHDDHVQNHVRTVRDFDTATGQRRVDGSHAVRNDVQGPLAHAAAEQIAHLRMRLVRGHPVVVGTCVFFRAGTDESEVLDAGDIARVGAGKVTSGEELRIECLQFPFTRQHRGQLALLRVGPVAPVNRARLCKLAD